MWFFLLCNKWNIAFNALHQWQSIHCTSGSQESLPDLNRSCSPRKPVMCKEHFNTGKSLVRKCSSFPLLHKLKLHVISFSSDSILNLNQSAICPTSGYKTVLWQNSALKTNKYDSIENKKEAENLLRIEFNAVIKLS